MSKLPPPYPRIPQRPREKPMQVLCLGLSRTGTLSTYAALQILGFEPYHMAENLRDAANGSLKNWVAAIEAKFHGKGRRWQGDDFEKMLWRYDAVTDAPAALFPEELIAAYPNAKVVLNVRDPAKWTTSIMDNFLYFLSGWRWLYLRNFDAGLSGRWYTITHACMHHWSGGDMYNPEAYKEHGIAKHNELVKSLVPKDRLLEFHPSQGWKPLCDFLGKDIPKEGEFPNINEGDSLKETLDGELAHRVWVSLGEWALVVMPVGVAAGVWWWYALN